MHNTEDKEWWCKHGRKLEDRFVNGLAPEIGLDVQINPDKKDNPYTYDLLVGGKPADLKRQRVPFFTAGRYGFDPQYTVTFNKKDYERYSEKYPGLAIYFWAEWQETTAKWGEREYDLDYLHGVWVAPLSVMDQRITAEDAPLHWYKRRRGDNQGNARASYLFDLRWLVCLWAEQ